MKAKTDRKVTLMLPEDLINRALKCSGEGLTPTIRKGLELVAARDTYEYILSLKGKYKNGLGVTLDELRRDRDE